MIKVYSQQDRCFINAIEKSESHLNKFLSENFDLFFSHLTFIKSEFYLDGVARSNGTSGRIDIFAFNNITNKFVIIELKRDSNKNIRSQASDYRDRVEHNFLDIYISVKEDHDIKLPMKREIVSDSIELILIAKDFSELDKFKMDSSEITFIKYLWLENDLLIFQYLNNQPALETVPRAKKIRTLQTVTELPSVSSSGTRLVLYSKKKGVDANARKLNDNKLEILAGSKVSDYKEPGFPKSAATADRIRAEYERDGIINSDGIFTQNVVHAKSTAESLIKGGSRDGSGWKLVEE